MTDQRCPECGERMGPGYDLGDECFECWELAEIAKELAEMSDIQKIKAKLREEFWK